MIAIIGGGISGLTVAWHLKQQGIAHTVYEADTQPGGKIRSEIVQGATLEYGPNTLYADQPVLDFIDELKLKDELILASPVSKSRFTVKQGQLTALPGSPFSLFLGNYFSWSTKWKMITEPFRKNQANETPESIAAFFRRRFNQEMVDYAINPFMAGVYAGNPEEILIELTMPRLARWVDEYGSITRGILKNRQQIPRKKTYALKNGLQSLPETIARQVNIQLNTSVQKISRQENQWMIQTPYGQDIADHIVLALPAHECAVLLAPHFPQIADTLNQIQYAPMTIVHSLFPKLTIDGFGALYPKIENLFQAGTLWSSSTFPHTAPDDLSLLTSFIGGMLYQEQAATEDSQLLATVNAELARLYGAASPHMQKITRWPQALPQYDKHALDVADMVAPLQAQHISICANWYRGISTTERIKIAKELAYSGLLGPSAL